MPERRYSQYKQEDVWVQAYQLQSRYGLEIHHGTVIGNSVSVSLSGVEHKAVVLARSSDWYYYRLNCTETFKHLITLCICGTHDSCLPVPVLAMDTGKLYKPLEMRLQSLKPKYDAAGKPTPDTFEKRRKSHYGHNMLIGALMCRREDALERLATLKQSTRLRIEAELRTLHKRRPGRPLLVYEQPKTSK